MIKPASLLLLILLLTSAVPDVSVAASALPPGAQVHASLSLSGGNTAVIYRAGAEYVGLLQEENGRSVEVWRRHLPFPASRLESPSPASFAGIGTRAGSTEGEFFAYRVAGGHVHAAVEGGVYGLLTAGEGVHLSHGDALLRVHDAAHQGSVPYSLVTRYHWASTRYIPVDTTRRPDYPESALPHPSGIIKTRQGDTVLIRLEVANTEQERDTGLMNRATLDADSGMVFVWDAPILESFWMENTYVPLTVAFLAPDGTIQEMQDMQPLTTDLHTPSRPYQYAIEVNLGFFARNGIQVGDKVNLQLT